MPEQGDAVYIFVRQIDSAGKGSLSVDHQDLAVVAVIIMGGNHRTDRGKGFCADAVLGKEVRIAEGELVELAHAVVHHADIHALARLSDQRLQDLSPHEALFDDEEFKEDELLRLLQLFEYGGEGVLSGGIIGRLGAVADRKASAAVQVSGQVVGAFAVAAQSVHYGGILREGVFRPIHEHFHAVLNIPVSDVGLHEQQHGGAGQGEHGDDEHPGKLGRGAHGAVEKINHHAQHEKRLERAERGDIRLQPAVNDDDDRDLQHEQQGYEQKPAEHQAQNALFYRLCQTENRFVFCLVHGVLRMMCRIQMKGL